MIFRLIISLVLNFMIMVPSTLFWSGGNFHLSLISPNFLGKESFRWFIGLVTDYKKVPDGMGGGYKAKVRIIGYHPDAKDIIPDDELPWAHVLVPLNMGSGEGGTGLSFNSISKSF